MALNPGDRVKLAWVDKNDQPLKGVIEEIDVTYKVKWDDGTEEYMEPDEIEAE